MNLVFRLIRVLLLGLVGTRVDPLGESRVAFRVWPNDLDINVHLNNGRYLTLMDLGRLDLALRAGLFRLFLRQRWRPVLGGAIIRYRRPLAPFQRYHLTTRILGWDEKWAFMEQRFMVGAEIHAIGFCKGIMLKDGKSLPMSEALAAIGYTLPSPPLPPGVVAWIEAEANLATPSVARPAA